MIIGSLVTHTQCNGSEHNALAVWLMACLLLRQPANLLKRTKRPRQPKRPRRPRNRVIEVKFWIKKKVIYVSFWYCNENHMLVSVSKWGAWKKRQLSYCQMADSRAPNFFRLSIDNIQHRKMQEIWHPLHTQNYLISKGFSSFDCTSSKNRH